MLETHLPLSIDMVLFCACLHTAIESHQKRIFLALDIHLHSAGIQQQQPSLLVPRNYIVLTSMQEEKLLRKRAQPLRNSKLIELSGWAKRKNLQIPYINIELRT